MLTSFVYLHSVVRVAITLKPEGFWTVSLHMGTCLVNIKGFETSIRKTLLMLDSWITMLLPRSWMWKHSGSADYFLSRYLLGK